MSLFSLEGKAAIVTGASGGIGRAIASVLHAQGAQVTLTGTREAVLEEVAQSLGGERLHVIPTNLAEEGAADSLAKQAESAMGAVDILVNNAGLTRDGLVLRMKDADFQTVLDVNLTATFRLSRSVLRGMTKRRWGRIIGITSVVGFTGNPGQANYAASKAGMVGMSKALAAEFAGRNVTVNCVAPGFIATAMTEVLSEEQQAKLNATIPAGRMGTADEVAAAVAFLASDEARYITGNTVHVNGGMAML